LRPTAHEATTPQATELDRLGAGLLPVGNEETAGPVAETGWTRLGCPQTDAQSDSRNGWTR
jgi:hypothetical protein